MKPSPLTYEFPGEPGSLGGVQAFAKAHGLKRREAQNLLQGVLSYTLHRPRRKHFPTLPTLVFNIDEQWVADLIELQGLARWNKGNRYALTVVDVLSKYAWVEPLKNKTGVAVTQAMQTILTRSGRTPQKLQTDAGKEFYNRTFQTLMKTNGIYHFSTHGDAKAALAERFNRTLKEKLYRYLTAKNTRAYLQVLQSIVQGYNATVHRSIGIAPKDVTGVNEAQVWHRLYDKRLLAKKKNKQTLLVKGTRVRLNKKHRPFEKGYLPGWTEEVFVIRRVVPGVVPTYKVQEWDGTPLEGTFYRQDLQPVTVPDDGLFRIEKVLQRKGNQVKVRWQGWSDKYDSWIDAKTIRKWKG